MTPDTNGWSRAEMYVLEKLGELRRGQDELRASVDQLRVAISALNTEVRIKSGIWGALSGIAAALGIRWIGR